MKHLSEELQESPMMIHHKGKEMTPQEFAYSIIMDVLRENTPYWWQGIFYGDLSNEEKQAITKALKSEVDRLGRAYRV